MLDRCFKDKTHNLDLPLFVVHSGNTCNGWLTFPKFLNAILKISRLCNLIRMGITTNLGWLSRVSMTATVFKKLFEYVNAIFRI